MIDLQRLQELAEKATPGPYVHFHGSRGVYADRGSKGPDVAVATMARGNRYGEKVSAQDNGDYFTATDPQTILALTAAVKAARTYLTERGGPAEDEARAHLIDLVSDEHFSGDFDAPQPFVPKGEQK